MLASLYSFVPLPHSIRQTFEIPGDPYSPEAADADPAIEYLRKLDIFAYRDDENGPLVLINPSTGAAVIDRERFSAYKSLVELDPDYFKVVEWEMSDPRMKKRRIAKFGDTYSWLKWNEPKKIVRVTETSIFHI